MQEIVHAVVQGRCITAGSTAWGNQVVELNDLKCRITEACARLREPTWLKPGIVARIHCYLHGSRLQLTDLDNLAKVVMDAAFSTGNPYADRSKDRFVWRLEIEKMPCETADERTEIWFFDGAPVAGAQG
jgi:hypothetical protein